MADFWNTTQYMGTFDINDEDDCLLPDVKTQLQQEINSKKEFDTGWKRCKRSTQAMRIKKFDFGYVLAVSTWCDSIEDMVKIDCDTSRFLTEDAATAIIDRFKGRKTEEKRASLFLERPSIKELLKEAVRLRDVCNDVLEGLFLEICTAVEEATE